MRPFARPLLVWIGGIILQATGSCNQYAWILLLFPLGILGYSCIVPAGQGSGYQYVGRWVWGIVFLSLLFFLSIQKTAYSEVRQRTAHVSMQQIRQFAGDRQQELVEAFNELRLSDAEKSVLATLTIGYREAMDRDVRRRFSATGVAHILSVSGFHVAIVCGFLSFFCSFFPRNLFFNGLKYLLTMGVLWLFVVVTGLAASAVRAGLMLTLYLTGRLLRRKTDRYNTLAASAFCMLVYEPLYLFDIGFQLSYLAVFSILYLQPRFNRLIEVRNPLLATPWSWIGVTLAAQAGTTLLCVHYFSQFPVVFLFTNLPLTLLATLLIPAGLVWMLLPAGFPGCDLLQTAVEWLTRSMLAVVDAFSRVPFSVQPFRLGGWATVVGYSIFFFAFLYGHTKKPRHLLAALLLLLILSVLLLIEKLNRCGI